MLTVTTSKITGNPGNGGWVQVHDFEPKDPEKLKLKGKFFAVISTKLLSPPSNLDSVNNVLAGREILSRLHEEYFGKADGKPLPSLKGAIEKVVSEFKYLGKVEIAGGAYLDGIFYSAASGGAIVSIFRQGMLANILQSDDNSTISASGFPQEEDIIILSTGNFVGSISHGVVKGALQGPSLETTVETLTPLIHAKEDSNYLGVLFLKFGEKGVLKETETINSMGDVTSKIGLQATFNRFKEKVSTLTSKLIPRKKIYVERETSFEPNQELSSSKKMYVTVGIILLSLLVISIIFGIRQKNIREQKDRYSSRLTQAQHELDEATSLVTLNPDRARELFVSSKTIADDLTREGVKDQELTLLLDKIKSSQGVILGEYAQEAELYLDLDLLTNGFVGNDLASSGEEAFVLDSNNKRVASFVIESKKTEVSAGSDQILNPKSIASYEDRVFVLEETGVFEVGDQRSEVAEKEWEGDVIPYFYAGNLYLLVKNENSIWRYSAAGDGFSEKQVWLGEGVNPNFSDATSITVDGSIWVLSGSGRVLKFTSGSPQAFSLEGVFPVLATAKSIYTNENLRYIYILNSDSGRIVVVDKEGLYKAQYISDKLSEASDIVVSESAKVVVFLVGNKLYSIELKHF